MLVDSATRANHAACRIYSLDGVIIHAYAVARRPGDYRVRRPPAGRFSSIRENFPFLAVRFTASQHADVAVTGH